MELVKENFGAEIHWPQIFSDSLERGEGLILFSGTRDSQLSALDATIVQKAPKARVISLEKSVSGAAAKDADIILYKGTCDAAATVDLINLAEEGRLVIQTVMAPSVVSSLHKVFSTLGTQPHLIWRYVDQLTLILNQMRLTDINERDLFIHEIMLATPAIKRNLLNRNIEELDELLKENKEDLGMVSFNQTLLQLLIRRRINMKTAFLKTRDPENLDLLLKRVGI
jgi:Tfp pilus assembly pilus retraction ATPase PilT